LGAVLMTPPDRFALGVGLALVVVTILLSL
jgi:hypothetical protein